MVQEVDRYFESRNPYEAMNDLQTQNDEERDGWIDDELGRIEVRHRLTAEYRLARRLKKSGKKLNILTQLSVDMAWKPPKWL